MEEFKMLYEKSLIANRNKTRKAPEKYVIKDRACYKKRLKELRTL
jgi:hypothetical protein